MKFRADILLVNKGLVKSRTLAVIFIKNGSVFANGKVVAKASEMIDELAEIKITETQPFVGRGGQKLKHALDFWNVNVEGKICLDIGSSTGGFTDCLLQAGAERVYAVDVGSEQLVPELLENLKVISLEKTDIRKVESLTEVGKGAELAEAPSLVVIDVSFISLTQILPHAIRLSSPNTEIIALIKPQFELDSKSLNRNGIVTEESLRMKALEKIKREAEKLGLKIAGETTSPITGGSGNIEFLIYLKK
ncbi:MAG: TlyA family RNA methyltransferase [bacterium]